MVSSRGLHKILILGALLNFGCRLALSYPTESENNKNDDIMLNDDYDYVGHDDQSSSSQPTKPPSEVKSAMPPQNRSLTVTGILGEDVLLNCDYKIRKSDVVMWYHGDKLISTGKTLVLPNFSLNSTTYDLTILKSSPQSVGDYYCKVVSDNVSIHTKLVLGDHSMDVLTPESSKSAQSSIQPLSLMWLPTAMLVAALQHYKH